MPSSVLASARRIVVKVGSSSLTGPGGLSEQALERIVAAISARAKSGCDIVLVSSGAIATGLKPLGLPQRPRDLATQQAAATVGQGLLMSHYARLFSAHDLRIGQVLLTSDDLVRRAHYVNAFRTLERLLNLGVVPIVNENDAVATHEIRFGDNDRLAALVAHLIKADALLLLSDVDAVYTRHPEQGGQRVGIIGSDDDLLRVDTAGVNSGSLNVGTGGMSTKLRSASIAADSGIDAVITGAHLIDQALEGQDVGTFFPARGPRQSVRKLWLAHLADTRGSISVDPGAQRALRGGQASLLAAGVTGISGEFDAGDAVEIRGGEGGILARGVVNYSSAELPRMVGLRQSQMLEKLGEGYDKPIVHIDDLALVGPLIS